MARQIVTELIADSSKFTRGTREATNAAQSFSSQVKSSVLAGVGLGAGIGAWNLLSTGITKAVDFLGDAVRAGMEEEASISKLNASLRANVEGWDGNTAAIEKTMKAGIDLAFSDEEQRDSLARLVAATHDVNKALVIQRTAMDLARFKGISLAEASDALTKVEAGSYRILKSLGIVLKDGATQTEALAAVQRVAAGQAEEYASTTSGKLLVAQTNFGEKMDELGTKLLPVVTVALDQGVGAMDRFSDAAGRAADENGSLVDRLLGLGDLYGTLVNPAAGFKKQIDAQAAAADGLKTAFNGSSRGVVGALEDVSAAAGRTAEDVQKAADAMKSDFGSLASYMLGYYTADINRAYDIEDARAGISADNAEAASLRKKLASGSLTRQETADVNARIRELDRETANHYAKLAETGTLSQKDYEAWRAVLVKLAAGTKGAVHAGYMVAIGDIDNLRNAAAAPITVTVVYKSLVKGNNANPEKSAGGNTFPMGGLSWVGEQGKELVYVPPGGQVFSNADSMRIAGGGTPSGGGRPGGGVTVNVYGHIVGPSGVDELMDMMARRLKLDGK